MLTAILIAMLEAAAGDTIPPPPPQPAPQILAPGVVVIPGPVSPGRGPDGNTIVFDAGRGLVVVDTGRHTWQSDAILAYAQSRRRPVSAIVNTHWHLDHTSGNRRIKAAFPSARVYATNGIDGALAPQGFLTREAANIPTYLADPNFTALQREEVQIFADTMQESQTLRPDVVLDRSARARIGGRRFDVHITNHAVTDADVWLYDRQSRVAVVGDLVTIPAPFFETACPNEWAQALDDVWATPFTVAIPGHGAPMNRAQFDTYRTAYKAFIDCVHSDRAATECSAGWASGVATLEPENERFHRAAAGYAEYYVGFLRENGGKSRDCQLAG